jgi:hypothetical protein
MRTIVIGLGIQGNKRQYFAGKDFQFSIDPFNEKANYKNLDEIDFNLFDSALLCIPDEIKFEYVKRLVAYKKAADEWFLGLKRKKKSKIVAA